LVLRVEFLVRSIALRGILTLLFAASADAFASQNTRPKAAVAQRRRRERKNVAQRVRGCCPTRGARKRSPLLREEGVDAT